MGVAGTNLWRVESLEVLAPHEVMTIGGYDLRFNGVTALDGPNYRAAHADIDVLKGDKVVAHLMPERRMYPAEGQETVQTAIRTNGFEDLYVALGDDRGEGKWTLRVYVNPLAPFIWLGAGLMALGGLASLWTRLRAMFFAREAEPAAA
jgi:cytochrome c-type biogenesis protein CcmF